MIYHYLTVDTARAVAVSENRTTANASLRLPGTLAYSGEHGHTTAMILLGSGIYTCATGDLIELSWLEPATPATSAAGFIGERRNAEHC